VTLTQEATESSIEKSQTREGNLPSPIDAVRESISGIGKYVLLSLLTAVVIVPFLIGPSISQRDQGVLLNQLSERFNQAASASGSADLSPLPAQAFAQGSPIALVEIPKLGIQAVVVEGSSSRDTARGIGHLFGTSTPGQEGNSVLVGRSAAYGAVFKDLKSLENGDEIFVSTVQGRSSYVVESALESPIGGPLEETLDNRLTLVTGDPPVLSSSMYVVVAKMSGKPFVDYPQNPNWLATHPLGADSFPLAELVLLLALVAVIGIGFRVGLVYFSKTVVYSVFIPIFLAQSVLIARVVFDFLPPVL
jgi:sortase A